MTTPPDGPRDARRATRTRSIRHAVRGLVLLTNGYVQDVARRRGLHDADVHAVGVLKEAQEAGRPVSAGELGRALGLSPAATSALIGRMEDNGHAERSRSLQDARRISVSPTASATALSDEQFGELVEGYARVLARYSDDELRLVDEVVRELAAETDRARRSASR